MSRTRPGVTLTTDHALMLAARKVGRLSASLTAAIADRDTLIVARRAEGASLREIASEAGITPMAVRKALHRTDWAWVPSGERRQSAGR